MVDEAKEDARAEGAKLLEAARADIEREVNRARETLRKDVAVLAVAGAEKVLGQAVDAGAHAALLDDLAKQL